MRLLIVIVNYRSADLAINCLRSLIDQVRAMPGGARIALVENCSPDDSLAKLSAAISTNGWGDVCDLQPLATNGGFAVGNNAAIRPALASTNPPAYVLMLNPDMIVRSGAIATLVDFMDANPPAGLAGSRLENLDGSPQRSAFRFHSIGSELEAGLRFGPASTLLAKHVVAPPVPIGDAPVLTDWACGASLIVRREVFERIGLLDERYFMYFEEADFCLRAKRAGWPCWYVPASRVVHLVGQSSGVTDAKRNERRRPRYWFDSRRIYFRKNHGLATMMLANFAWLGAGAINRVRKFLTGGSTGDPKWFWLDFCRYNFSWAK